MKDAYWFKHDANARNDQRLIKLRMKHGPEGYGIYFMIIEILRDTENYILNINDITSIAYDIRANESIVLDVLKNYDLFEFKGQNFHSRSLTRRMMKHDDIKIKRREAGKLGGMAKASAKQVPEISLNKKEAKPSYKKEIRKREDKKEIREDNITTNVPKLKKASTTIPYKDRVGEYFNLIDDEMTNVWKEAYPNIDIESELGKAKAWLLSNTAQAKKNFNKFCNNWLSKAMDNAGRNQSPSQQFKQNGTINEATSGRYHNLAEQSKRFRKYMDNAEKTAADPTEIGQILGQTIERLKPKSDEDETKDG